MAEKTERQKFEEWARKHPGNAIPIDVTEWGTDWWYTDHKTKDLWYGWKARAALGVEALRHESESHQTPIPSPMDYEGEG